MSSLKSKAYDLYCRAYRGIRGDRAYRRFVFGKIYAGGLWGGDGTSEFYSGDGSRGEVARHFVKEMAELLRGAQQALGRPITIVDLGCGDFEVGKALLAELPEATYVGCDVVATLVARNNATYGSDRVSFRQLDIVTDPLPPGDVCLVRQVLQHLSNVEIGKFLKRARYERLYVTEGEPIHRLGPTNPDKPVGQTIRFDWITGTGGSVELDKPPFNMRTEEVIRSQIPGHEMIVTRRVITNKA